MSALLVLCCLSGGGALRLEPAARPQVSSSPAQPPTGARPEEGGGCHGGRLQEVQ